MTDSLYTSYYLKELLKISDGYSHVTTHRKAARIYEKAVHAGKFDLAKRISNKYGSFPHLTDNKCLAFALAINADKKVNKI